MTWITYLLQSRLQYTCFDVSRNYIAFGTTAGGGIILQHDRLAYLKTITVKEGPICQIALAPDDNIIGFATSRGIAIVMEHNADRNSALPQKLQQSYEHKGALVTVMQWNAFSTKLFVGDDKGKVSIVNVSTSRTRNFFQVPTATLMKLDSKIVQLDYAQDRLLVSTLTRCYLCDTTREQFSQIGKKLRDGEYGACFFPGIRSVDQCTIYSARPGSRMWEVDLKGNVLYTHQFKPALAVKSEKLFSFRNEVPMEESKDEIAPQSVVFNKMLLIWPGAEDFPFILTWSQQGAYIFDPKRAQMILWTEDLKGIKDAKCHRNDVYCHYLDGRFVKYTLMTAEYAVSRLYQQGLAIQGAQLILLKQASLCSSRLNIHIPTTFLLDMLQKVSEMGKSYLFTNLTNVLGKLGLSSEKVPQSSCSRSAMSETVRLGSGIYIVNKSSRDLPGDGQCSARMSRWRSASPVFRTSSVSPHSSPSRFSDRVCSSPKQKRSGSPRISLRDKSGKSKTASMPNSIEKSPDSIDSSTSGRTSVMSDETPSSGSSREHLCKERSQTPPTRSKLYGNKYSSWTAVCNHHNMNELKNSLDHDYCEDDKLIINHDGPNFSLISKYKENSIDDLSDEPELDNKISNMPNLNSPISLNLCDLSKEDRSIEKKVSFESYESNGNEVSINSRDEGNDDGIEGSSIPASADLNEVNSDNLKKTKKWNMEDDFYDNGHTSSLANDSYGYTGMSLYGGPMIMPNLDMSFLFRPEGSTELLNLKESLTNKITSGKNLLLRNLRDLELRLRQNSDSKCESLDAKPKIGEDAEILGSHSAIFESDVVECSLLEDQEDKNFWSFLPSIDTIQLIEATKYARGKTRDPYVIFDKNELRCVLEEWLNHLYAAQMLVISAIATMKHSSHLTSGHSMKDDDTLKSACSQVSSQSSSPSENVDLSYGTEQEETFISDPKSTEDDLIEESTHSLNIEISESSTLKTESLHAKLLCSESFIFVHDPLRLNIDDHEIVSELALLCFQLRVFGRIDELCDIESRKSKADDNEIFLSNNVGKISLTIDKLSVDIQEDGILEKKCDSDSSLFLKNFFHLLDTQRIRELLIMHNTPCLQTWTVLLDGAFILNCKDEFNQRITSGQFDQAANCLERSFAGAVLVSHLLRIYKTLTARAVQLCLHRSYDVTPLDVLYLSKSSGTYPESFLSYVAFVIDCLPEIQRPRVLEKLLHPDEVRWAWITGILQEGYMSSLKCNCGWPRPGSHTSSWKYSELLLYMISSWKAKYQQSLELCFSFGFWKGYLLVARKLQLHDVLIKTMVHLADVSLLGLEEDFGYVPELDEEWKNLLEMVVHLVSVPEFLTCITCGERHKQSNTFPLGTSTESVWEANLNLETVSKAALTYLGPIKVLSLLQDMDNLLPGTFSAQFYQSLIMSFLMTKQQSALTHRMVTTVGSYLWSRRPLSLSPEVYQVFQKEKQKMSSPDIQENESTVDTSSSTCGRCYLEEPEAHWGTPACIREFCSLCKISLTSHLSSLSSGVIVYDCGHVYHAACLPEGFCVACMCAASNDV